MMTICKNCGHDRQIAEHEDNNELAITCERCNEAMGIYRLAKEKVCICAFNGR